jgi:hypothetical protein
LKTGIAEITWILGLPDPVILFEYFGGVARLRFVQANSGVSAELAAMVDDNKDHCRIRLK